MAANIESTQASPEHTQRPGDRCLALQQSQLGLLPTLPTQMFDRTRITLRLIKKRVNVVRFK